MSTTPRTKMANRIGCPECKKAYVNTAQLEAHLRKKHNRGFSSSAPVRYRCPAKACAVSYSQSQIKAFHAHLQDKHGMQLVLRSGDGETVVHDASGRCLGGFEDLQRERAKDVVDDADRTSQWLMDAGGPSGALNPSDNLRGQRSTIWGCPTPGCSFGPCKTQERLNRHMFEKHRAEENGTAASPIVVECPNDDTLPAEFSAVVISGDKLEELSEVGLDDYMPSVEEAKQVYEQVMRDTGGLGGLPVFTSE